jgi:hypothetical protein
MLFQLQVLGKTRYPQSMLSLSQVRMLSSLSLPRLHEPSAAQVFTTARAKARVWPTFLHFSPFRVFFAQICPLQFHFKKIDPLLGAIIIGAEATHSGATFFGASIFVRGS